MFIVIKLLLIIVFIAITLILVSVVSGVFVIIGYILSIFLPLNLFQCTLLAIGSSFILMFGIATALISSQISHYGKLIYDVNDAEDKELDKDDEEMDDDDKLYEDYEPKKRDFTPSNIVPVRDKVKIGRNDPCHCGSGRKYKYCCGR